MKKLLAVGLVSFSLSASLAEARFFLGLDVSYGLADSTFDTGKRGKIFWGSNAFKFNKKLGASINYLEFGINLGTQHYINDMLGWRWFFGLNYGQNTNFSRNPFDIRLQSFGLQLGGDILFNFTQSDELSFGAFTGIASNLNVHSVNGALFESLPLDDIKGGTNAGLIGRVGLALIVGEHSRLELSVNIPIMQVALHENINSVFIPVTFTLGQKIVF